MLILCTSILRLSSAVCVTFGLPPFRFDSMVALFRSPMVIIEGINLQASPSTCIGIVFEVTIFACLHCVMQVPCPPAWSKGWKGKILHGTLSFETSYKLVRGQANHFYESIFCARLRITHGPVPWPCSSPIALKRLLIKSTERKFWLDFIPGNVKKDNSVNFELLQLGSYVLAIALQGHKFG